MDVSILQLQGGMFITQSLAGNNRLGGQDFNELVQRHFVAVSLKCKQNMRQRLVF